MYAETIDDVIQALDEIVAWCEQEESCLGYFPALYRKVTLGVKQGIAAGRFEDGPRMERLDVVFANRYLEAFDCYRKGERPTRAWAYGFKMAGKSHVLILQHLLLGMNAHINLDLGVAAAQVAATTGLAALRPDFDEINNLLAEKVDEVQDQLSRCSPLMPLLDHHARWVDEAISNFSLRKGRQLAWWRATRLSRQTGLAFEQKVRRYDRRVAVYGRLICPEYVATSLFQRIRDKEVADVRRIIGFLL